jgi:hypothetical protein
MHEGSNGELPISIKCRIGIHYESKAPFSRETCDKLSDEQEYSKLQSFIETIASDGIVDTFIIHARIAVLGGDLSAADNRRLPPVKYEYVRRLTRDYPELHFVLNGGIHSLKQAQQELDICNALSGVMVGRGLVANPWNFAMVDELLHGDVAGQNGLCATRRELLQSYGQHVDYEEQHNDPALIRRLVAPCAHIFAGEANSKQFRMELDDIAGRPERLEREAKAQVWSSININRGDSKSLLSSAFTTGSAQSLRWDDLQAMDDARPSWDENQPPLSELILEAAQRNFGGDVLDLNRRDSYNRKLSKDTLGTDDSGSIKMSGGVVDGWYNELN